VAADCVGVLFVQTGGNSWLMEGKNHDCTVSNTSWSWLNLRLDLWTG